MTCDIESAASHERDFEVKHFRMQTIRGRALLSCLVLIGVASACAQNGDPVEGAKSAEGAQLAQVAHAAPDFTLVDCAGQKHTLSALRDKIVVLEWVNQDCPYYRRAIPVLKALSERYGGRPDVVWLGIESTHYRKADENVKLSKEHGLDYPILMDTDGRVGRLYEAKTTPQMYVINRGVLVYAGALHDDPQGKKKATDIRHYTVEALEAVLAGKDVPLAQTTPWGCSVKYHKKNKTRK